MESPDTWWLDIPPQARAKEESGLAETLKLASSTPAMTEKKSDLSEAKGRLVRVFTP